MSISCWFGMEWPQYNLFGNMACSSAGGDWNNELADTYEAVWSDTVYKFVVLTKC